MKADVTVLIPFFNPGVRFLKKAVDSVFIQTYNQWKIIFVDDASTDQSLKGIKEYIDDPRITLLTNHVNLGQSKAQNVGLDAVDTPYIIKLDSDDWFFPDTIEVMMEKIKSLPENVGLLWGNKTDIYEDREGDICLRVPRIGGESHSDKYKFLLSNLVPFPRFYRTNALREVGGWPTDDPWDGRVMEDRRIDVRLIERFEIHWMDAMLYNYRQHPFNATKNLDLYNEVFEWHIYDTLKRWGNEYEPIFKYRCGWKQLAELKPVKKKKSLFD
ncbi:glycosyltransferase family 2 protein [Alkalihalobacillus sp. AL-G]|uniref:glycosyltransferase family 2 protein n=1 Tax=Alkalihalobacillus sp. AL-G TaxID=2926399 RepID=UPI00272CB6A4|nr:glycosyltransferase family 2 protein [Alkalihalobacillus sp. AL-G]WLD94941.1 glycosyltransferase family 2 protein [Alkalihalobacillus sp. AL-G]